MYHQVAEIRRESSFQDNLFCAIGLFRRTQDLIACSSTYGPFMRWMQTLPESLDSSHAQVDLFSNEVHLLQMGSSAKT